MSTTAPPPPEPRPAGPADVDALASLERAGFGAEAWSPAQLEGGLARPAGVAVVLDDEAGEDGTLLASAMGWAAGGEAELERIVVAPRARRRGLGRTLLAAFARACATRGAERLFLEVRADNLAAIGLYEALGFEGAGRRAAYYADGCDARLFALDLTAERLPAAPSGQKPGLKR